MKYSTLGALGVLALLVACGAPPPAPTGASGLGAAPAATIGGPGPETYREQVIAAARAEGEVNALLQSTWTPEGIKQLEDAVEREYGVRIKIHFTPVMNYLQRVPELLAELAANITPSFDLYQTATDTSARLVKEDVAESVPWAALLPAGTPPRVAADSRLLVVYTQHSGLMFDPTTIDRNEAPRSIKDLANPRWRGKLMLNQYSTTYLPYAVKLGREETLGALRGAVQNGAVSGTYSDLFTRFAAKEYPMATIQSTFYLTAQKRGIAADYAFLDFVYASETYVSVVKRVKHPNAAKLVAAVLAGPEGQRIGDEHLGLSNHYYGESVEHRLAEQGYAAGLQPFRWADMPNWVDVILAPEQQELQRALDTVLQGG